MLKSQSELSGLGPNSTNVYKAYICDKYSNRPTALSELCNADFAIIYTYPNKLDDEEDNGVKEADDEEDSNDEKADDVCNDISVNALPDKITLKNEMGKMNELANVLCAIIKLAN